MRLDEGLGARYPAGSETAARRIVDPDDDRFNQHNLGLIPTEYWEIQNLPLQTRAPAVFEVLQGFGWTVLPIRQYERGDRLFWIVGTTTPCPQESGILVGSGQRPLVCNKLPDQDRAKRTGPSRRARAQSRRSSSASPKVGAAGPRSSAANARSPSAPPSQDQPPAEPWTSVAAFDPWAAAAAAKFGSGSSADHSLRDTVKGLSNTVKILQEAQKSADRRLQTVEKSADNTRLQTQKLAQDVQSTQAAVHAASADVKKLSQQVTTMDTKFEEHMMTCLTLAVQQGILAGGSADGSGGQAPGQAPGQPPGQPLGNT